MIVMIRHGQDWDNERGILNGQRDQELTEYGKVQIASAAVQLLSYQFDLIITSPLKRARESAEILTENLGYGDPIIFPDLVERDFGILTEKLLTDIPRYASKIVSVDGVEYFLEVDGAEDFPTLFARASRVLKKLQKSYPSKSILIVTHGDMAKMLRAAYQQRSWLQELQTPYLNNGGLNFLE